MIKDTALTEFLRFPWAVCVKAPGLDAAKLKASSELINAYYLLHFNICITKPNYITKQ